MQHASTRTTTPERASCFRGGNSSNGRMRALQWLRGRRISLNLVLVGSMHITQRFTHSVDLLGAGLEYARLGPFLRRSTIIVTVQHQWENSVLFGGQR